MKNGDEQIEQSLQFAMEKAIAGLHFEHASRIREDIRIVKWLSKRLTQFQLARESKPRVYSVPGWNGNSLWYLLRHGGIEYVLCEPTNATEYKKVLSRIQRWLDEEGHAGTGYCNSEDTLGFVTSWLQKNKPTKLLGSKSMESERATSGCERVAESAYPFERGAPEDNSGPPKPNQKRMRKSEVKANEKSQESVPSWINAADVFPDTWKEFKMVLKSAPKKPHYSP